LLETRIPSGVLAALLALPACLPAQAPAKAPDVPPFPTRTPSSIRFVIEVPEYSSSSGPGVFELGSGLALKARWKNIGDSPVELELKDHDAYHGTLEYPLGIMARVEDASGKLLTHGTAGWEEWWTWYYVWSTTFQPEMPGDVITLKPGEEVIRTIPLAVVLNACTGLEKGLGPGAYKVQLAHGELRSNVLPFRVVCPSPGRVYIAHDPNAPDPRCSKALGKTSP
jgi:hypothetical protein